MFPTYDEIKEYVKTKGKVTVYDLVKNFNQRGEDVIESIINGKKCILCFGVKKEFFEYLEELIKNPEFAVKHEKQAYFSSGGLPVSSRNRLLYLTIALAE